MGLPRLGYRGAWVQSIAALFVIVSILVHLAMIHALLAYCHLAISLVRSSLLKTTMGLITMPGLVWVCVGKSGILLQVVLSVLALYLIT